MKSKMALRLILFVVLLSCLCIGQDSAASGKWEFKVVKSQMDNSETAIAILPAETKFQGQNVELVLGCNVGHGYRHRVKPLDIWVDMKSPLSTQLIRGEIQARVRFDDDKPRSESWQESSDFLRIFHSTFSPKGQIEFAHRIANAHRMLIELEPFLGTSQVVEFHTDGLTPYVNQMSELCGWPK